MTDLLATAMRGNALADSIEKAARHWESQGSSQFSLSLTFPQARVIVAALRACDGPGGPGLDASRAESEATRREREEQRQRLRAATRGLA